MSMTMKPVMFESTAGLIFKEKKRLLVDDEILSLETEFSNILRTGETFHRVRKEDIVAIRSFDSGYRSLMAIILGVLFLITGLGVLQSSISISLMMITIGVILVIHGLQKEFTVILEYLARSSSLPVFIPGVLQFNGQGTIPFTDEMASIDFLNANVARDDEILTYRLKETFLTMEMARKTIRIGKEIIIVKQEGKILRPNGFVMFPTKNLISVRVNPISFRSPKWGVLGIFLALLGLIALSQMELDTLPSALLYTLFGIFLILWGFQRITKISFTYMVFGNRMYTVDVEGITVDPVEMLHSLGDVAMQASLDGMRIQAGKA